jgi:hypothetical protein
MLSRSKAASAFLAQDHRLDDRARRRVIPLHQQHPHGLRMHLVSAAEEGNAAHPAQVLADDEQCHRHAADGQLAERRSPASAADSQTMRNSRPNRRDRSSRSACAAPGSPSMTNRTGVDVGNRPRPAGEALI